MAKKKLPQENVEDDDDIVQEINRWYASLSTTEKIAHGRATSLRTILRWRMMMRNTQDGRYQIVYNEEFFRDRIRESQIMLLKLRAWRSTGREPGSG